MKRFFLKCIKVFPLLKVFLFCYWNKFYFWLAGVKYGNNFRVYNSFYLKCKGKIIIGDDFHLTSGSALNPISRNIQGAFFTENLNSIIEIGDRVGMSSVCLWAKEKISIGNDVNIGSDCLIIDNDSHPHDYLKRRNSYVQYGSVEIENLVPSSPIIIEDDVWIGTRCIILKGVHIGARSIIAAGSVVTKDIPSEVVAAGNPCRVVKQL